MKLLLIHAAVACCLLAAVLPETNAAKLDLSPELTKRLSIWLQKRERRDLSRLRADSAQLVRPEDVRDSLNPHSSIHPNIRVKRSKMTVSQPRKSGCALGTCTVHDLAHRLHQLNNNLRISTAPMDKISPLGYGRRRRSLPSLRRLRRT